MLCDECGKNKATVHLTEIVNDQISKLNLCEVCAKAKGADAEQHFGIADLLAALSDVEGKSHETTAAGPAGAAGAAPSVLSKTKCAHCGLTYEDFKKVGRLGCGGCYTSFKSALAPLLKKIHGSTQHLGKSPTQTPSKDIKVVRKYADELERVRAELQSAIKREEFEEAAALRDKVKFLEKKIKGGKD